MIEGLQDFLIVFLTAMQDCQLSPGVAQDDAINAGVGLVAEDVFPGGAEGFLGLGHKTHADVAGLFGSHSGEDEQKIDDAAFFAGSCLKGKFDPFAIYAEAGFKAVSIENPEQEHGAENEDDDHSEGILKAIEGDTLAFADVGKVHTAYP